MWKIDTVLTLSLRASFRAFEMPWVPVVGLLLISRYFLMG